MDKGGVIESVTTLSSAAETLLNLHAPVMPAVSPPCDSSTFTKLENIITPVTLLHMFSDCDHLHLVLFQVLV